MTVEGTVAVVLSFPRSGTHFMIDFMRKNIAGFNPRLPLWSSSENLYYNLDRALRGRDPWARGALLRPNFIVKSHALPFAPELETQLTSIAGARKVVYFTPYRAPASILASYARYTGFSGGLAELLASPDPFYANGATVGANFEAFFEFALQRASFVEVAEARDRPERLAEALSQRLGAKLLSPADRLPSRRKTHRWFGEIMSRLQGRETSEVVIQGSGGGARWTADAVPPRIARLFSSMGERNLIMPGADRNGPARIRT